MVSCGLHGFRNVQTHPGLAHANEQGALALIDQLLAMVSTEQRAAFRNLVQALLQRQSLPASGVMFHYYTRRS